VRSAIFFAGGSDAIVSPRLVRSGYQSSRLPAAYAELAGASHFAPIGNGGGFRGPSVAWARSELAGDQQASALFRGASCGLCSNRQWTYQTNAQFGQAAPPSARPPAEAPEPSSGEPVSPDEEPGAPAPGGGSFGGGGLSSFLGGGAFG
jgi:hypothetical protein